MPLIALRLCVSVPPYCVLLVVVDASLLCFVGVFHRPHATLCWCLSMPLCCVLFVFITTTLLHSFDACQTPLLCSIDVRHGPLLHNVGTY